MPLAEARGVNKSDLLASISPAMLREVAQEIRVGPQTQTSIHVEDVPPTIRNTAYEMAGAFFESNKRSPKFRAACRLMMEQRGLAGKMTAETFAIIFWPQYVNIAIEFLTEGLTWLGIPQHEKDAVADDIILFNELLDARAASAVRVKKMFETLN